MSDTIVKLKTMADLQTESIQFYIDAYQRGYRWTQNEVRDLLDDIREFSQKKRPDDGTFYCLQPVIVTKAEDGISWKVIDGQQRLTTIYLIYSFYLLAQPVFVRKRLKMPFELTYNNKPNLQKCLKTFVEKEYSSSDEVEQNMADFENDIDCHYVIEAYKFICDYFCRLIDDPNTINDMTHMKEIFDKYMKIIWYEVTNADVSTEVEIFSKINMGKIALTNAELIKALLLKNDGANAESLDKVQTNIAVKWDEIEAQLSEDSFWSFLVNEKRDDTHYSTRIDFIFRVMARELNEGVLQLATLDYPHDETYTVPESVNRDKFSFYVFSNYVRFLQKHPEKNSEDDQNYIELIWDRVCEYYRMFKDWYKNITWYHMIGFLVETSKKNYIDQIIELSKLYREGSNDSGKGHKDYFEDQLREKIITEVFGDLSPSTGECREFINDLDYTNGQDDIRKVLLLYNVAYLEACHENGRFPFEKYKDQDVLWDLEHINPIMDTRPDDDRRDSDDNPRKQWLEKAVNLDEIKDIQFNVPRDDGKTVYEVANHVLKNRLYLSKNQPGTKDFIQVYETIINFFGQTTEPDNSIGNLTLLDGGTNRSYKNDVFPLKRKTILSRTMTDVFIPLCTRKVFMKGFADSSNLLRWGAEDKKAYIKEIIDCICEYLKLEDRTDGE